jgi:hypothetical protein
VRSDVVIWFDPTGALATRLAEIRTAIERGDYRRKLFMGLPYYAQAVS